MLLAGLPIVAIVPLLLVSSRVNLCVNRCREQSNGLVKYVSRKREQSGDLTIRPAQEERRFHPVPSRATGLLAPVVTRQMYGRANFDLLRQRLLLCA